jgi:hypothetical protein
LKRSSDREGIELSAPLHACVTHKKKDHHLLFRHLEGDPDSAH